MENKISNESGLVFLVIYTLIKHNQIITRVGSNYWNMTYKFGIWVPTGVDEVLNIDR